ncbi:MAG: hypothetical protein QOD30_1195 [Actinomycetota bacterium]|nr:hypothetical protein [Actinomycetota bacterium]
MPSALFSIDGDAFVPTGLARGPWSPDAQHGGPVAALLMRAMEAIDAPGPMQVARATFELLRPVPLAPLTITTATLKPGRRVQLVGASLFAEDVEVVRATALRLRTADIPIPDDVPVDMGVPELPENESSGRVPFGTDDELEHFHRDAMEIRAVAGGFDRAGPGTAWFRLRVPVIEGEEPSGAMRAVATADFGNGLSWILPGDWLFINPDLTVHLLRVPVGEWICLAARTLPSSTGVGMAESAIYDERGRVGRSVQSLLIDSTR